MVPTTLTIAGLGSPRTDGNRMAEIDFDAPNGDAKIAPYIDAIFDSPNEPLERDSYGRPLVPPPPDGWPDAGNPKWERAEKKYGGRRPYQRISTFQATLDNGAGLAIWKGRHLATQTARERNADLRAILAGLRYAPEDFARIDEIIEQLLDRGAGEEASLAAANWGTAGHRFMEKNAPPGVPERLQDDVDAYTREHRTFGITIVENELSVVNDRLGVFGTLDSLIELEPETKTKCPKWNHHWVQWMVDDLVWFCHDCEKVFYGVAPEGEVRVEDKKTGKLHLLGQGIQLYAYSTGQRLDIETGERTPIHPRLSKEWAMLAHVPLGKAFCVLHEVNLIKSGFNALTAMQARDARSTEKELFRPFGVDPKKKK